MARDASPYFGKNDPSIERRRVVRYGRTYSVIIKRYRDGRHCSVETSGGAMIRETWVPIAALDETIESQVQILNRADRYPSLRIVEEGQS